MSKKTFGDQDESLAAHEAHLNRMVDYYARTAPNYNKWHCNPADDSSHNYAVKETLRLMRRVGAKTLLDICCGTGRATKAALDAGYNAKGIDISPELLEIARRDLKIPGDRLDLGDATKLPYSDSTFDVACILGALHHTAMPQAVVSESLRVAKLGVVISDEGNHITGGIKSLLIRLGLFEPVYRCIFGRPPRTTRRQGESDGDGPAFAFSIEEIIPQVKARFPHFQSLTFYRVGGRQLCSYRFPRLFARQAVVSAWRQP